MPSLSLKAKGGGQRTLSYALNVPEPFPLIRDTLSSWPEMTAPEHSTPLPYLPVPSGSPSASSRSNRRKQRVRAITTLLARGQQPRSLPKLTAQKAADLLGRKEFASWETSSPSPPDRQVLPIPAAFREGVIPQGGCLQ